MNIKRTLIGMAVGIFLWGTVTTSVHAIQGKRGNVGTAYDVDGMICTDEPMGCVAILCNSVHRTQIGVGLFQEKETCFVTGSAVLPDREIDISVESQNECALTTDPYAKCWSSDYKRIMGEGTVFATNWDIQVVPGGVINVVSYYNQ